MRLAFLGLGLIGGSIVRALREPTGSGAARSGDWRISAWSPAGTGPRIGHAQGLVDHASPNAATAVEGAELVVLAAPPLACLELLGELAGGLRGSLAPDAVITDVASTKQVIVDRATTLGLRFVGGHPMAGVEASGFEAADPALFRDRPWVVVPSDDERAMARVEAVARACGATTVHMDAAAHDAAVAAVSHLPLVLASALVEAVAGRDGRPRDGWSAAAPLAAGGWRSMTRLARGDVGMGTGIAVTNAPRLAARLEAMRDVIDDWLALLGASGGPDEAAIRARLASARAMLEAVDDAVDHG